MTTSPSIKQLREFGLFVGIIFPLFIGWLLPSLLGHEFRIWTIFVSIPLIILGCFSPKSLKYVYKKWFDIGNFLAYINSHLILGAIFIFIMQPIALFMKLFGYDPLRLKRNNSKSYREIRKNDKIDLEKIF